jgi:DNA-binding LacI/PurR family transcriptional regulator
VATKRVTIKDIAAQCGVSNMTVSVVLNQSATRHVRVSQATRERVQAVALEMQYRPNRAARILRSGATNVIGLYSAYGYLNPHVAFTAQLIGGLHLGCDARQQDLLLHGSYRDHTPADIQAELADGRVDGLVLYTTPTDLLGECMAESHFPVVAIVDALPGLPSVVADDADGARQLVAYLADRGHRRFFYRGGSPRLVSAVRREQAFSQAVRERGMELMLQHPQIVKPRPGMFEVFTDADLSWLSLPREQRPTAAACWNDNTAYHLLEECRARGVRVPEDLAVVGYDGISPLHPTPWCLTTIHAPWVDVAQTSVDVLLQRVAGKTVPAETVLPVRLIPGNTA